MSVREVFFSADLLLLQDKSLFNLIDHDEANTNQLTHTQPSTHDNKTLSPTDTIKIVVAELQGIHFCPPLNYPFFLSHFFMSAILWPVTLPQCKSQYADFSIDGAVEMDLKIQSFNLCVSAPPLSITLL